MLMKKQIHDLHVQLGKSDDQAWYQTHIDIQEYDSLLTHMSQTHMVKQFIEAQNRRKSQDHDDDKKEGSGAN